MLSTLRFSACTLLFLMVGCQSQEKQPIQLTSTPVHDSHSVRISGKTFEGAMFSAGCSIDTIITSLAGPRFTPTQEEITAFEAVLPASMDSLDQGGYQGPRIHEHLSDYYRQYFGCSRNTGERYLYVAFRWKGAEKDTTWITTFANPVFGGSQYWQAWFDVASGKVIMFRVNPSK